MDEQAKGDQNGGYASQCDENVTEASQCDENLKEAGQCEEDLKETDQSDENLKEAGQCDEDRKETDQGDESLQEAIDQSGESFETDQNDRHLKETEASKTDYGDLNPEETLQRLTADINRLDEQEKDAKISSRYDKNRVIFLMQSTLLGISYSIIWPTLWVYVKDFKMTTPLVKFVYGITFVAYPVASIVSAHVVERTTLSTKSIIMLLGLAEIVGNLVFALNFHPCLLVIGRLIAGLGDAFYVILMRDMKSKHGYTKNEGMTMECLAAFILGVILSPGINIVTTLIPFKILSWQVGPHNYPGLSVSILFIIMEVIVMIFLPAQIEKETSVASSRSSASSISISDDFRCWGYKAIFVGFYSFLYTYIVSYFEITIPMIIYEIIKLKPVGAMLLYAVLGTLYAMILMLGMSISLTNQLEASIGVTVIAKTAGMFGVLYLGYSSNELHGVICLGVIVLCLALLWSNDDILFINLVRTIVPTSQREYTHNLRKNISKGAFALAAVSVPFVFEASVYIVVIPILIFCVYFCFSAFVVIRYIDHRSSYKQLK